ncbi:hypothetical protein COZ22_00145, partial [bacterium (Candidatus Howlettbacteria) CG_4_10_14_3_um_filter_37_10]
MTNKKNTDKELWEFHQTENIAVFEVGHPRQDMLYKQALSLRKDGNVLEIGFGDGYLLNKLAKNYHCYGADISQGNLKRLSKSCKYINTSLIDIDGKIPFKDNMFDFFIASEVLEHMNNRELMVCIKEMLRVLKPDGYAILTVPADENLKNNECFCPNCKNIFHRWGHEQTWSIGKVKKEFKEFKIIKIKKFWNRYIEKSKIQNLASYMPYILRIIFGKILKLENSNYLIILKKKS